MSRDADNHIHSACWLILIIALLIGNWAHIAVHKHERRMRVIEDRLEITAPAELRVTISDDHKTEQ